MFKTNDDLAKFLKLDQQFDRIASEVESLSKKKPDGVLNKFKLDLINTLLDQANDFLDPNHLPFEEFKKFDEGSLPTNSDVLIILSQYQTCLDRFESANQDYDEVTYQHHWLVAGKRIS